MVDENKAEIRVPRKDPYGGLSPTRVFLDPRLKLALDRHKILTSETHGEAIKKALCAYLGLDHEQYEHVLRDTTKKRE